MRMKDNCRMYSIRKECPFLRRPEIHSGFTGWEGPRTWWHCDRTGQPIREMKSCSLSGNREAQKATYIKDRGITEDVFNREEDRCNEG